MTRPLDVFLPLRRGVGDARGPFLAEPATWLLAPATGVDDANWRSLRWDPSGDGHRAPPRRLLPVLDAQLGLAPDTTGAWSLVLSGSYDPPAAWFGEMADALLLHRVTTGTLGTFLAEVARRLEAGQ